MDNETIGTASVKITADISQLKQQIEEAKTATESLKSAGDNFKVTWMGEGAGSIQDYNNWLEKANKEWEEYEQKQENIAQSAEVVRERIEATTGAIQEQNATTERSGNIFEQMGEKLQHASTKIGDSWRHAEVSVETASRKTQTALIGLATAITLYGKSSISEYAKYNKDAAQAQEDLERASSRMKATIGQLLQPFVTVISGLMDWISQNKALVAGLGTTIAIIGGTAGLIALVKKLSGAFAALKATAGGVVGILSLVAGVAVGAFVSANDNGEQFNETLEEQEDRLKETEKANKSYASSIKDMNETIADAMKGIEEANRSYEQSLKKILVNHEDTVDRLTQQIKDANDEYKRAIEERNAEFALNQQKEEEEHADKVKELTNQINFLQRYNNKYNKEKLEALKFALAEENARYQKQTKLMKDELDLQNQNEKERLDKRLAEYNSELQKEEDFLRKHRDTLNAVRGVILDDEIQSLQRQHKATIDSYNKTIEEARKKGAEAGYALASALQNANGQVKTAGEIAGKTYSTGFLGTVERALRGSAVFNTISGYQGGAGMTADKETANIVAYYKEKYGGNWKAEWQRQGMGPIPAGYARGGYTGQGDKNEVAGVVHRGEYVLPQEQVDQSTGKPKAMGNTFNINVSGVFATSALERRKVAEEIMRAFQQTNNARLGA